MTCVRTAGHPAMERNGGRFGGIQCASLTTSARAKYSQPSVPSTSAENRPTATIKVRVNAKPAGPGDARCMAGVSGGIRRKTPYRRFAALLQRSLVRAVPRVRA